MFTFNGMVPGDSMARSLTIINNGSGSFSYTLSTSCTAGCTSILWTNGDAVSGLQLTVARGATTIYNGPIQVTNQATGTLAAGASDGLTLTVKLPANAGNASANQSVTVTFTWTGS